MKKQFFYAAFAIALMASCTSENEPLVEQPTPDAEERVAIGLGVNTPSIVASRGTGTVGNVAGEEGATSWNEQSLNIVMINKETGDYATEDNSPYAITNGTSNYILDGLTFKAPKSDATDGKIRIYKDEANSLLQFKYYPVSGTFDFYGYHVDGITGYTETITPKTTGTEAVATVTNIQINGTQDILAAQTIDIPTAKPSTSTEPGFEYTLQSIVDGVNWANMATSQFSAKTARNGFTPILDFKHQLARLKFYVKSGNAENGAQYKWDETNSKWVKRQNATLNGYEDYLDGAIYITGITAMDMHDIIDITLNGASGPATNLNANSTGEADFVLKSLPESGTSKELVTLIPVAPMFPMNATSSDDIDQTAAAQGETITYTDKTPIGESIMFYPNGATEIVLKLDLLQVVPDTMTEGDESTKEFIAKPMTGYVTLSGTFDVGSSYDVFITIYSLEEIKVSAQLTAWTDGGDVDVDIEDNATTYPATTQP